MDLILEQIAELNTKVDALYTMVSRLDRLVSGAAQPPEPFSEKTIASSSEEFSVSASALADNYVIGADRSFEHKDVLAEPHYLESDSRRADSISPELQTQRLTAQLTAAYNRIAALEEQLLSQRIQ